MSFLCFICGSLLFVFSRLNNLNHILFEKKKQIASLSKIKMETDTATQDMITPKSIFDENTMINFFTEEITFSTNFSFVSNRTSSFVTGYVYNQEIKFFVTVIASIGLLLNGLALYLTWKHKQFHKSSMYVRLSYVILDFATALCSILHSVITHFITDTTVICLFSNTVLGLFLSTIQFTAFNAIDRYYYFCRPMIYKRVFTTKVIIIISSTILLLCFGYIGATELIIGRRKIPNVILCQLPNQQFYNQIQFFLFFLPCIVCTLISIQKIKTLLDNFRRISPNSTKHKAKKETGKQALR